MPLRICSYEDRPAAMDSLILMGESLCRVDSDISLHLTVPDAPDNVHAWAAGRREVVLSTERSRDVGGWDVKPWLLLQQLDAGSEEALWLDADMIVTRSVTRLVKEFPKGLLLVAEEWDGVDAAGAAHLWHTPLVRPLAPVNSCFIRITAEHRRLLEHWLESTREPAYREAQALPFDQRAFYLASDQVLLTALLGGEEFREVPFDSIRLGRHIAQCAGSSGYRPGDRLLDLFRGLPAMIHCIGRKPWALTSDVAPLARLGINLATDVSAYVLAARPVARSLGMDPEWLHTKTTPGRVLTALTGGHPALAGLPLACAHSFYTTVSRSLRWNSKV